MDRRGSHKGYVRAKNNQAGFEVRERPIELEHVSYNREGQYNAALDSMEDGTNEALVNGNSDEACVQTKIPKLTGAKKELYDHVKKIHYLFHLFVCFFFLLILFLFRTQPHSLMMV